MSNNDPFKLSPNENQEADISQSVTFWIQAAKEGDKDAGQAIFDRYFSKLVEVSRNRVQRTKRVEDEEDAAIQAMFAFLSGIETGKFPDVQDRASLWPLLIDIVIKNSKKQLRKQHAVKRGGGLERGESVFVGKDQQQGQIADYVFDSIDGEDFVLLKDSLDKIKQELSELDRQILDLKLECRSNREIAKLLERPPRTIDRKITTVIMPALQKVL